MVSTWNGSAHVPQSTNKFLYDNWNLIAELNAPNNGLIHSYAWGQDLSGTMVKAGGIGGLLMLVEHGSAGTTTNHFAAYDGNGNVMAFIKTDTTLSARYEYNPYGGLLRSTGPLGRVNPFRFSTKFWDEESGLVYYGYRYYNPSLGRWISRDPGPDQLLALYCFSRNAPTVALDPDGRSPLLIAAVISGAAGAIIGAVTAPDGDRWLGAGKGALAGFVAPFVGFGVAAVTGESAIAGGIAAGLFGSAASSALDNYQAGKALYDFAPRQFGTMAAAGIVGAVSGFTMAYLEHAGVDVGDWLVDGMLAVAGAIGVGAADLWGAGAESGYESGVRIFQQRASDIESNSQ